MKKQYTKPSMKAIPFSASEMLCGSGKDAQSLSLGDPKDDGQEKPAPTSLWGSDGIFGD